MNDSTKKYKSFPFYSKYNLKEYDEGPHKNNFFKKQEWWYYNFILNDPESELKNWSAVISFATFPHTDNFRLILHDNNKQKTYGDSYLKPVGTCKSKGPAVNVSMECSYAIGRYPKWHVYANNKKMNKPVITVDLYYKANSMPIWLVKNTGLNQKKSPLGYYCIMNCGVKGDITIDDRVYKVKGLGYHDHTWMPLLTETSPESKKKLLDFNIWDWLCIHFDNKIDMFVGKIHTYKRSVISNVIPGSLCISAVGEKSIECYFFMLEYLEFKKSSIPSLKIPTKIHIKTPKMNILRKKPFKKPIYLDIYYEVENIKETIPRDPPTWCEWESTGKAYGKIKSSTEDITLNGWGIMETTGNV